MITAYHIEYGVTAILFLFIISIYIFFRVTEYDVTLRVFCRLLICVGAANIVDVVSAVLISHADRVHPMINMLLNSLYFFCLVYLSLGLLNYIKFFISEKVEITYRVPFKRTLFIINLVMLLLNLHYKFIFDFTPYYDRKGMFFLVFILPYYYVLNAMLLLARYRKFFQKKHLFTLASSAVFCIAGGLLQTFLLKDYLLILFCAGVSIPSILFTMETPDYKKMQRNLKDLSRAREQAQLASNAKSNFLANMSHEIRSPIHAIIGMAEMIEGECQKEGEKSVIKVYGRDIQNAGEALLALVNNILDYSKIQSSRVEILPVKYEINVFLADIWKETAELFKDNEVKLYFNADKDIPLNLYGDSLKIQQILMNLISNARKYTLKGEVRLDISSEKTDDENVLLVFTVRDTGPGIEDKDLDSIFISFEQAGKNGSYSHAGTGLGLFINKSLAEMMGGRLEVRSKVGEGTEFKAVIPQKYYGEETIGRIYQEYSGRKAGFSPAAMRGRVLVVDDTPVNLKIIKNILEKTGLTADISEGGEDCIKKAEEIKYGLILMDYMMTGMNGVMALNLIRQSENSLNKDTPAVMLTADREEDRNVDYKKEGFSAFLTKPVNMEKLMETLHKYLD